MPSARAAHVSVEINGKVYVIGGAGEVSTSLWEYDRTVDRWRTDLPEMSVAREHLAAAALGGKIYVVGGRFPGNTTAVEMYDPAANRWTRLADMPTARGGFTVAAVTGRIQAFGGEQLTGGQVIPGHDVYDPVADRWRGTACRRSNWGASGTCWVAGCRPGARPSTRSPTGSTCSLRPEGNSAVNCRSQVRKGVRDYDRFAIPKYSIGTRPHLSR
jgi:N-acetylneuraminic acid mutarotase